MSPGGWITAAVNPHAKLQTRSLKRNPSAVQLLTDLPLCGSDRSRLCHEYGLSLLTACYAITIFGVADHSLSSSLRFIYYPALRRQWHRARRPLLPIPLIARITPTSSRGGRRSTSCARLPSARRVETYPSQRSARTASSPATELLPVTSSSTSTVSVIHIIARSNVPSDSSVRRPATSAGCPLIERVISRANSRVGSTAPSCKGIERTITKTILRRFLLRVSFSFFLPPDSSPKSSSKETSSVAPHIFPTLVHPAASISVAGL